MTDHANYIAIICPALGGNGAVANVALHQARELAGRFRVTLVSDSFPVENFPGIERLQIKPWHFGFLRRFAHVPNEIAFALAARKAIFRLHATRPISMLICHGHPVATLAARPLQQRLDIPYALVTHGDIFDRPKGTYDPRLTWLYQRTTLPAYRDADLVVALSPHMAALAISGGARPERVSLIPNGIDPADIGLNVGAPLLPKTATGRLELLYVGRLSVEKGVDVLIEAAALLRERGVSFHLRIAGSGAAEQALRDHAAALQLDNMVEFIGPRPRKELGALYRSADIVCVPSRSDPLPTVVLEAMAAGVAVVGSDVGGIPFMVQRGLTGWLVPPDEAQILASLLAGLSANPIGLIEAGVAAKLAVMERFLWEQVGEKLASTIAMRLK